MFGTGIFCSRQFKFRISMLSRQCATNIKIMIYGGSREMHIQKGKPIYKYGDGRVIVVIYHNYIYLNSCVSIHSITTYLMALVLIKKKKTRLAQLMYSQLHFSFSTQWLIRRWCNINHIYQIWLTNRTGGSGYSIYDRHRYSILVLKRRLLFIIWPK